MHTKQLFSISETKIGSIIFKSQESIIHSHQHIGQFAIDQMSVVCLCFVFVFVFVFSHFGRERNCSQTKLLSFWILVLHLDGWYLVPLECILDLDSSVHSVFIFLGFVRLGWVGFVTFVWVRLVHVSFGVASQFRNQFCMYCSL